MVPAGGGLIPEGTVLKGPVKAQLEGDTEKASLGVTLNQAELVFGKYLNKPAGTPLELRVTAQKKTSQRVILNPLELKLGNAHVDGELELSHKGKGPYIGRLQTTDVAVKKLRSLFPVLAEQEKE